MSVTGGGGDPAVASQLPGRTRGQCEARYVNSLDAALKRGRWTEPEDLLLIAAVNKYGPQDWRRVAAAVPGRNGAQCRARWIDVLDYKRNSSTWSLDEDEALLVGVQIFGRRESGRGRGDVSASDNYSKVAKLIAGRNTSDVKARIRTFVRWKVIVSCCRCRGCSPATPTSTLTHRSGGDGRRQERSAQVQPAQAVAGPGALQRGGQGVQRAEPARAGAGAARGLRHVRGQRGRPQDHGLL